MKVSVLNLGCKVNQAECADIEARLISSGWNIADLADKPELCIINTCSVTAKSDYQSRQLIRRAERAGARVIVTGCYAELNREAVAAMKGVERVVANSEKSSIVEEISGFAGDTTFPYPLTGRSRFFLKVQDGCNYSCSYCIIPKARGRSRSSPIYDVVRKAERISSEFSEVVLTGIHLGTYGYDLIPNVTLSDIVRSLLKTNIQRIRLSSLEVTEIQDDLLELFSDPRLCRHLHVPLQSGDDKTLRLMNRTYDSRTFLEGIERIHKRVSGIALGTDVIVGFPGEDNEAFMNTKKMLESLPFSYLHVFPYSPRPGARAACMAQALRPDTKRERVSLLMELGRAKKRAFMMQQIGEILDPLVEELCEEGSFIGTTGNYLKVRAPLVGHSRKEVVSVRITGCSEDMLLGVSMNIT